MKTYRILTLYLDDVQSKNFESIASSISSVSEVVHLSSLELLLKELQPNKDLLFYAFKGEGIQFQLDLEVIQGARIFLPLNIIFYKRDFNALFQAFQFNINHILEDNFSIDDIQRAILKSDLKGMSWQGAMQIALQNLFETPIKVKNNSQMYQYLRNYFLQLDCLEKFAMIKISNGEGELIYGSGFLDLKQIVKEVCNITLPEKSIGKYYKLKIKNIYCFPLKIDESEAIWGVLETEQESDYIFNDLFLKFLQNVHMYQKVKDQIQDLTLLANTDEVTGLFNQRKLAIDLEKIIESHSEINKSFSVMFIDVDYFKRVNDLYGHVIGSQMLVEIGKVLKSLLRDSDLVYRYGGDEFVAIMTNVDTEKVHNVALRILNSIKNMDFKLENGDIYQLSISIGIAEYPKNAESPKDLIRFADEMMYESKKSGRGKVFHMDEVKNADTRFK